MNVDTNPRIPMSRDRLRRLTFLILAAGFAAAIIIYFTAGPNPSNPLGYDPLETKKYIHDLELYGGKANVLAAQFNDWFFGLWHGKNLALTTAVITVLIVLLLRFIYAPIVSENEGQLSRNRKDNPVRYFKTYSSEAKDRTEEKPDERHFRTRKRT